MNWFHLTIRRAFEPFGLANRWNFQLCREIAGLKKLSLLVLQACAQFRPLMIVILFSFLGYTTFDIGSNFA